MEFWGVEVKPGESVKCDAGEDKYLHLSQASLGETKKDKASENVTVFVKFNDQKLVLGTLSGEKFPQISYDIVFEKEFELSHSSKSTSVFFCGYKTVAPEDGFDGYSESDSEEEDIQLAQKANGKPEVKEQAKPTVGKPNSAIGVASSVKRKVKAEESVKADKPKTDEDVDDDDDDDEDDEDDESEDEFADEDMPEAGDDSDDEDEDEDDDESSDEDDEATPKKDEKGKKRLAGSASKTPVPEKKAKLISPAGIQKTGGDGKKGGHTATPHPAKHVGKTPANSDKPKQQTPKSGAGSVTCKSCSKTFNSDNALQAHTKAKHLAAK